MLQSITLKNYKSYRAETEIGIAPLTILCGTNSSGKSSILKSALMLRQTVENASSFNKLLFSGNYVDNGYWKDIISSGSAARDTFTITNTFVIKLLNRGQTSDVMMFKELNKLYSFVREAEQYKLTHRLTVAKSASGGNSIIGVIASNDVIETRIDIEPLNRAGTPIDGAAGYIMLTKEGNSERRYTLSYANLPCNGRFVPFSSEKKCICYFNNIKLSNIYKEGINPGVVDAKPSIFSIFNIVSSQYSNIEYITPLRLAPRRRYAISSIVDSVGPAGENMAVLYAKLTDDTQRKTVIPMPPAPTFSRGDRVSLNNCLAKWAEYIGIGNLSVTRSGETIALNLNGHNLADVGFGVSQVLPILVQCFCMSCASTLFLEQPEIHLHPKMQMNVADLLLAVASTGCNLVVETHSDHIINRIVRRCMEDPELNKLVRILFVSKDSEGWSQVNKEIEIDPVKGLTNCPPDFFDQYGCELQDIMQQGLKNFRESRHR